MFSRHAKILATFLAFLSAGCYTNRPVGRNWVQSRICWGEAAGGLQIGIAAEGDAPPPGQPQPPRSPVDAIKIYLRNTGSTALTVLDPNIARPGGPAYEPLLIKIAYSPSMTRAAWLSRPTPARALTLTPGQMTWTSLDIDKLRASHPGTVSLLAEYTNQDSTITGAAPDGPARPSEIHEVWTGEIHSSELELNSTP